MAESSIEWTGKTWNPTTGCTKISKECDFCYAETLTNRWKHNPNQPKYKAGFDKLVMHKSALKDPYEWKEPSFRSKSKAICLRPMFRQTSKAPENR